MLDRLAKRYGVLPSDILAGDAAELTINLMAMFAGLDLEDSIQRSIERAKGFVVPVRVL